MIARVHIQAWQSAYAGIVNDAYLKGLSIEERTSRWHEGLSKKAECNFVAENDGKIVGWITFGQSRDKDAQATGEIYGVYVHPDFWGCGFGRKLMAAAEADLWGRGFNKITLWVLELNDRSRVFYSKSGYFFDGARQPFSIGGQELQILRYAKNLEETHVPDALPSAGNT